MFGRLGDGWRVLRNVVEWLLVLSAVIAAGASLGTISATAASGEAGATDRSDAAARTYNVTKTA